MAEKTCLSQVPAGFQNLLDNLVRCALLNRPNRYETFFAEILEAEMNSRTIFDLCTKKGSAPADCNADTVNRLSKKVIQQAAKEQIAMLKNNRFGNYKLCLSRPVRSAPVRRRAEFVDDRRWLPRASRYPPERIENLWRMGPVDRQWIDPCSLRLPPRPASHLSRAANVNTTKRPLTACRATEHSTSKDRAQRPATAQEKGAKTRMCTGSDFNGAGRASLKAFSMQSEDRCRDDAGNNRQPIRMCQGYAHIMYGWRLDRRPITADKSMQTTESEQPRPGQMASDKAAQGEYGGHRASRLVEQEHRQPSRPVMHDTAVQYSSEEDMMIQQARCSDTTALLNTQFDTATSGSDNAQCEMVDGHYVSQVTALTAQKIDSKTTTPASAPCPFSDVVKPAPVPLESPCEMVEGHYVSQVTALTAQKIDSKTSTPAPCKFSDVAKPTPVLPESRCSENSILVDGHAISAVSEDTAQKIESQKLYGCCKVYYSVPLKSYCSDEEQHDKPPTDDCSRDALHQVQRPPSMVADVGCPSSQMLLVDGYYATGVKPAETPFRNLYAPPDVVDRPSSTIYEPSDSRNVYLLPDRAESRVPAVGQSVLIDGHYATVTTSDKNAPPLDSTKGDPSKDYITKRRKSSAPELSPMDPVKGALLAQQHPRSAPDLVPASSFDSVSEWTDTYPKPDALASNMAVPTPP